MEKSEYKSLIEWRLVDPHAYAAAYYYNIIDKICEIYGWKISKPNNYWTLERCKKDALKYASRKEWRINSTCYSIAHRHNWLDDCCKHMTLLLKPVGYWTLDKCKKNALEYITKTDWKVNNEGAYSSAYDNGWIEDCCKHMIIQKNKWTLKKCKEDAIKYKTRIEWNLNSQNAYNAACRHNWLDECCAHMKKLRSKKKYWTLETCKKEAFKYKSKIEYHDNNRSSYRCANKNGWLDECCTHMKK